MRILLAAIAALGSICFALIFGLPMVRLQAKPTAGTRVDQVIADQAANDSREVPVLTAANVQVSQGKNMLKAEGIIPAGATMPHCSCSC